MEVMAGLLFAAVQRLTRTWKVQYPLSAAAAVSPAQNLPAKHARYFQEMRTLMSVNYRNYREALLHTTPPCMPYIGTQPFSSQITNHLHL